jgi:drug/metabolite transporter (DMT)-like permease
MECLNWRMWIYNLQCSAFFSCAQAFNVFQFCFMSPGTTKVLGQIKLLLMALVSGLVLGRKHSRIQWLAICVVLNAVLCFVIVGRKTDGGESFMGGGGGIFAIGVCLNLMHSMLSVRN